MVTDITISCVKTPLQTQTVQDNMPPFLMTSFVHGIYVRYLLYQA